MEVLRSVTIAKTSMSRLSTVATEATLGAGAANATPTKGRARRSLVKSMSVSDWR